jgi:hypothetical protein
MFWYEIKMIYAHARRLRHFLGLPKSGINIKIFQTWNIKERRCSWWIHRNERRFLPFLGLLLRCAAFLGSEVLGRPRPAICRGGLMAIYYSLIWDYRVRFPSPLTTRLDTGNTTTHIGSLTNRRLLQRRCPLSSELHISMHGWRRLALNNRRWWDWTEPSRPSETVQSQNLLFPFHCVWSDIHDSQLSLANRTGHLHLHTQQQL